jgi:hypothetical protein
VSGDYAAPGLVSECDPAIKTEQAKAQPSDIEGFNHAAELAAVPTMQNLPQAIRVAFRVRTQQGRPTGITMVPPAVLNSSFLWLQ